MSDILIPPDPSEVHDVALRTALEERYLAYALGLSISALPMNRDYPDVSQSSMNYSSFAILLQGPLALRRNLSFVPELYCYWKIHPYRRGDIRVKTALRDRTYNSSAKRHRAGCRRGDLGHEASLRFLSPLMKSAAVSSAKTSGIARRSVRTDCQQSLGQTADDRFRVIRVDLAVSGPGLG